MKKFDPIKCSITLTTAFFVVLIIVTVSLPLLVTLYVKLADRHENLMTTIMVTCYPCSPFVGIILLSLKKLLKNIASNNTAEPYNIKLLKYMAICCLIISVITLIAGRYYLPFWIVSGTFMFLALIIFTFKNIFAALTTDK